MNNDRKQLIPDLRFPEFVDDKTWAQKAINDIAISQSSSVALNKLILKDSGFPVYGADSIVGYIDKFQQKDIYVSIVKDGSGVGRLNLCVKESSVLGTLAYIKSKDAEEYNIIWIYYLLNTIDFTKYIKGAGIPHIYFTDFKEERIAVPTPKEQQKIAFCLSSLDELITAQKEILELLKNHKKGLMQNLFPQEEETVPKFRFPEFENDGEWAEKRLGEICYNISSGKDKSEINGKFNLYGSTGIIGKTEIGSYEGDYILVARVGANAGLLNRTVGIFGVTDNTLVLDLKNKESINFLFFLLENFNLNKLVFGSGQPLITGGQLKDLSFYIPANFQEQQKIASCLFSLDELISSQTDKLEKLQLHKKGLMQGLFPKSID